MGSEVRGGGGFRSRGEDERLTDRGGEEIQGERKHQSEGRKLGQRVVMQPKDRWGCGTVTAGGVLLDIHSAEKATHSLYCAALASYCIDILNLS